MLTKKKSISSYFSYFTKSTFIELYKWAGNLSSSESADYEAILIKVKELEEFLNRTNSMIYVFDYIKFSLIHVSDNSSLVTGYSKEEWLKGGLKLYSEIFCPADVYASEIIAKRMRNHNLSVIPEKRKEYSYLNTFRLFHKAGYYNWYLNNIFFILHDHNGKELLNLSIMLNIDDWKTNDACEFQIRKHNLKTGSVKIIEKTVYPAQMKEPLSTIELDILTLISKGYKDAKIGKELNLTEDQIKNHRKKMIKKTWCSNITELLSFALRNKLILP